MHFFKQFCQSITGPYEYSSAYCLAPSNVKCTGKESRKKVPYSYIFLLCCYVWNVFHQIQTTSVCTTLKSFIQIEFHHPLVEIILLKILGGRMQTKTVSWATTRQCNEPSGMFIKGRRQATCLTPYFQAPRRVSRVKSSLFRLKTYYHRIQYTPNQIKSMYPSFKGGQQQQLHGVSTLLSKGPQQQM